MKALGHLQKFKPQISMGTHGQQNEILRRMRFATNKQKIATYSNS